MNTDIAMAIGMALGWIFGAFSGWHIRGIHMHIQRIKELLRMVGP